MARAAGGLLGGGRYRQVARETGAAVLVVAAPRTLRTGEFFEIRMALTAKEAITRPTIAIGIGLARNTTFNSFYPAAEKERSTADAFEFDYAPLKAGESMTIKIDGQI